MKRLLMCLVFFVVIVPVMAQDVAPVPTEDGTPVVVIESPANTSGGDNILVVALTAVISFIVGAGSALGMAARWIKEAIHDPVKMTMAERLGSSIPQESVKGFVDFLDAAKAFVVEATDKQSMVTKLVVDTKPE